MTPSTAPDGALQAAIYRALTTSAEVAAAFPGGAVAVWDSVRLDPSGKVDTAAFPYITIGEDEIAGQTNSAWDPSEAHCKIEVWSRARGKAEVKRIAGAVRTALDVALSMDPFNVSSHTFVSAIYRREPDGLTERAILTFRYIIGPGWRTRFAPPI